MFSEPRNWKWMVPGGMTVILLAVYGQTRSWGGWSNIWLGLAIICGLAGGMNLLLYAYQHAGDIAADVWGARFSTPEVRMFEAAKGMHPEAVKALLTQRRVLWRIKYVAQSDLVDWILDEAPSVHVGFAEFVFEHSSMDTLMPISMLSEGAYLFDPDKLITDRQQYNDLLLLLQQKLMVTQAYGNQSAKWISPWNPQTIRRRFGLDDDGEAEFPVSALGVAGERAGEWVEKNAEGKRQNVDPVEAAMGELEQTAWMKKQMETRR